MIKLIFGFAAILSAGALMLSPWIISGIYHHLKERKKRKEWHLQGSGKAAEFEAIYEHLYEKPNLEVTSHHFKEKLQQEDD